MIRSALTIFIAALALFCAPSIIQAQTSQPAPAPRPAPAPTLDYVFEEAPSDHTLGNAEATDTLILYASNVCPHCGSWFANDWPSVKSDLVETGQLRFVFRPLPSQPIQLSLTGFLMAECAPAEDYMAVIEDQFARQTDILTAQDGAAVRAQYDAIARKAGLADETQIAACLNNEDKLSLIQTSSARAQAAGISGIPAFIFNGQVMSGAHDADAIKGWVEGRSTAD
jgi:protein-disulfide isomerase